MRAILESYDSELAPTEYSPQLNKRLREAEDILQKTQNHNAEMEVRVLTCADTNTNATFAFIASYFSFLIAKCIVFKTNLNIKYLLTLLLASGQFSTDVVE